MTETNIRPIALIIDDEADIRELLMMTCERLGVDSREAETVKDAERELSQNSFNLCITDMRLPDGNGLDIIRLINRDYPKLPVAMLTAHGNMDTAIEALKAGAFDFVNKPIELKTLNNLIKSALRLQQVDNQTKTKDQRLQLLGESDEMYKLRNTIDKLARSQAPIYIKGESGTGKELVARLIHQNGPRSEHPFIPVNCGAIPSDLIESELFGHVKGSFTGATQDREGLFQAASGGTLFLDEVADLPLDMQVKLLRAIQEKSIRPVGASKESPIDVRILSATHQDLSALVKERAFREDLFFRINVIELPIPSLRDHAEDIPVLVEHITNRICKSMGLPKHVMEKDALKAISHHSFPGNVRELENVLERAITLCEENRITLDDLQLSTSESPLSEDIGNIDGVGLDIYLANIERKILTDVIEKCRFNKTAAAKKLKISLRSLRYRLERLGIN
jgi:two-component system response regulator PilR (NtrC family)